MCQPSVNSANLKFPVDLMCKECVTHQLSRRDMRLDDGTSICRLRQLSRQTIHHPSTISASMLSRFNYIGKQCVIRQLSRQTMCHLSTTSANHVSPVDLLCKPFFALQLCWQTIRCLSTKSANHVPKVARQTCHLRSSDSFSSDCLTHHMNTLFYFLWLQATTHWLELVASIELCAQNLWRRLAQTTAHIVRRHSPGQLDLVQNLRSL